MSQPWDFRPERVESGAPNGPHDEDPTEPAHWYRGPWYAGILAGLVVLAVAIGFLALGVWLQLEFLYQLSAIIGFAAAIPFFGGLASLFRRLFGEKAFKVSVVVAVGSIIVACTIFLVAVVKSK